MLGYVFVVVGADEEAVDAVSGCSREGSVHFCAELETFDSALLYCFGVFLVFLVFRASDGVARTSLSEARFWSCPRRLWFVSSGPSPC
jgi:hypothetical protein